MALAVILLPSLSSAAVVVRVHVRGEINWGTAILVDKAFKRAREVHADAVLIVLDTPGGLLSATKRIVSDILSSKIPVITYVYPPGAFSASAGSLILIAGNIAAMANGTSVGAATPYLPGFPPRVVNKTVNYIASYAGSIAEMRGRPVKIVEEFVTRGLSLTAREAYRKGVVDVLADNFSELFKEINGKVVRVGGRRVRLNFRTVEIVDVRPGVRFYVYKILTNPFVVSALLLLGLYLLIFGLMTPGRGMELLGAILLLLSLPGLGLMRISVLAVVLIALAVILLILELLTHTAIFGILSILCLTMGFVMLIREPLMPKGFYQDFEMLTGGVSLGVASIMTFVITRVAQVRGMRARVGGEAMLGEVGEVIEFGGGRGRVKVRGEIWFCISDEELKPGERVVVVGRDGLTLKVRRYGGAKKGNTEVAGEDKGEG